MKLSEKIDRIFSAMETAEQAYQEEVEEDEYQIDDPVIFWDNENETAGWYWGGDASAASSFEIHPSWVLSDLIVGGVDAIDAIKLQLIS